MTAGAENEISIGDVATAETMSLPSPESTKSGVNSLNEELETEQTPQVATSEGRDKEAEEKLDSNRPVLRQAGAEHASTKTPQQIAEEKGEREEKIFLQ